MMTQKPALKVRDIMVKEPVFISPESTLQDAAQKMQKANCGVLPVGNAKDIKGIITDRDIVVRSIARGKNPATEHVKSCMTPESYSCREDDSVHKAAEVMKKNKVSRLLVKGAGDKIVGILSFGTTFRNDASSADIANVIERALNGKKAAA